MNLQKFIVLGIGGTIAGRADSSADNIGYRAGEVGVDVLLDALPAIKEAGPVEVEQVAQLDSKDMSFAVWAQLARRVCHFLNQADVKGIVITHGTDTLEETAYFLQAICQPEKPVVLTCAMRPATALVPDGPQNMLDALAVARHPEAKGVVVVCAGTVHTAQDVQKVHPYQLDAFSSGDAGPLGYVEEGVIRLLRNWPVAHRGRLAVAAAKILKTDGNALEEGNWPQVEILTSYAGADGAVVGALVAKGIQGLVVASTGNGTIHHALEAALVKAQAQGVRVVRATRCPNGRILPRPADPIPDSEGLSPVKARVELILQLMN